MLPHDNTLDLFSLHVLLQNLSQPLLNHFYSERSVKQFLRVNFTKLFNLLLNSSFDFFKFFLLHKLDVLVIVRAHF